jgi:glycosyltransferase involved in cell wall biosynthesis
MISVIIPTYNEEAGIRETIRLIREYDERNLIKEIIITDGGSTDNTKETAKNEGAKVVISPSKGRGAQMNYGASIAQNEILYFLNKPQKEIVMGVPSYSNPAKLTRGFLLKLPFTHIRPWKE